MPRSAEKFLFVSAFLLGLGFGNPLSAENYRVNDHVSDGFLNMRTGPGLGHDVVVAIPEGSGGLTIGECQSSDDNGRTTQGWCRAEWSGHSGWVSRCCIAQETGPTQSSNSRRVSMDDVERVHNFCAGLPEVFNIETVGLDSGGLTRWCASYQGFFKEYGSQFPAAAPYVYKCGCRALQSLLSQ